MRHLPERSPDPEVQQRGYRPRIMLAEDDDDFRLLLASMLEGQGYRVLGFSTGPDLLAGIQTVLGGGEAPALVITDERMPGMRGLSVLEQARNWGITLPLILITSFGDENIVKQAQRLGVTVMNKPFDMNDLRTLVDWLAPRHAG